jgi:Domain of unknown function (DUF4937
VILKRIRVHLCPGAKQGFLSSQEIWERESRCVPGFLGGFWADEDAATLVVYHFWRSRADLDRFMRDDHDRIAETARSDLHYTSIEVEVLDVPPAPDGLAPSLVEDAQHEAGEIQRLSELYRVSLALRAALRIGLFEALGLAPRSVPDVAGGSSCAISSGGGRPRRTPGMPP